jgi:prolyl-tRNA synthetase
MLNVYTEFAEKWMAVPVIKGVKTANERFAGAEETFCIEALVQDGKAIQAGTSHFLGQNFAKAFDVTFTTKENKLDFVWATSWGVSTRLIGTLIMAHSDDNGLVLPPNLAPIQVVIIPIARNEEQLKTIDEKVFTIKKELEAKGISVKYDNDDKQKPGWKFAEYELKGIPVRIAIGPRDLESNSVEIARRDTLTKSVVAMDSLTATVANLLEEIQSSIYNKALAFREDNITQVDSYDEFKKLLDEKAGFLSAHWDGTTETELAIKEETKATIRCIPIDNPLEDGKCIYSGKPSKQRVLFARAY